MNIIKQSKNTIINVSVSKNLNIAFEQKSPDHSKLRDLDINIHADA